MVGWEVFSGVSAPSATSNILIKFLREVARCYSRAEVSDPESSEFHGYVQECLKTISLNPETDIIYLCGNPNMIDASFKYLHEELGFQTQVIRREKYISSN